MTAFMQRLLLVVVAGLLALTCAAPAMASTRSDILKDCSDDSQLQGSYSPSQIRDAREHMGTDTREYTDCPDVLRRAELPDQPATTATPATGTTTGGTTPPPPPTGGRPSSAAAPATPTPPALPETPQDQQALADAAAAPATPLKVGDTNVVPIGALSRAHSGNDLPPALIVALILLAVAGVALSIPPLRRRLPFTRPAS